MRGAELRPPHFFFQLEHISYPFPITLNMLSRTARLSPSGLPSVSSPSWTCSCPPNRASNRCKASASRSACVFLLGAGLVGWVGEVEGASVEVGDCVQV